MQNGPLRLPPGYKFHPTDEELIDFYLERKVNGGGLPDEAASLIKDYNIYGEEEPTITENLETELEAGIVRKEDGVVEAEDIFHDLTDFVSNELAFQVGPNQQLDFIASFNDDHVKETISDKLHDIEMADYLEAIFNGYHISQIIRDLDQFMPSLDDNPAEESEDWA